MTRMITFQDFEKAQGREAFLLDAIRQHRSSEPYRVARSADLYDRQMNETIHDYVKIVYNINGLPIEDFTASNNRIASNFFNRLNTQRCMYSLGNGVSFLDSEDIISGATDATKEKLGGVGFDNAISDAGYYALIHGVSFCFWNYDRLHVFPLTQFVPLYDEYTGELRAGIRFWKLSHDKPLTVVLYEEDGYTKYVADDEGAKLNATEEKHAYKQLTKTTVADGETVVGEENYSSLPIVPMWGNKHKQSTLIGMREAIDSFDLIRSGFANDLTDCAEIYWLVENYGGMTDGDLARFRDRTKLTHVVNADTSGGGKITPYVQELPYAARKEYLTEIRSGLYEDFGGLDVHTIAAGATNDHIDAAYQPLDENAADFERWVTEAIMQILKLAGIEDTPIFKRNRISNQLEQVQMVVAESPYLDQATVLRKLPNITPEEVAAILNNIDSENQGRFVSTSSEQPAEGSEE